MKMESVDLSQVSSPLPWQQPEWMQLTTQLARVQLPHALLLVGEQYIGKSHLALALARLLLCSAPEGVLNCGQCHACELSARGNHGDFRWVDPEEKSRVIKIDQIRDVVRFTNGTASFGLRKVMVLTPVESLNVNAFNALLKPLEEPAEDTYWILVCHRLHAVPATIRSRCQILHLPTPNSQVCLKWLENVTGSAVESARLLALSDGLPLLAQELHFTGTSDDLSKRRFAMSEILAGNITLAEVAALWGEENLNVFLMQLARALQRLLCSQSSEQLKTTHGRSAFYLLEEVNRLQRAVIAGANPGKQIMMEALLAKSRKELGRGRLDDNIGAKSEMLTHD